MQWYDGNLLIDRQPALDERPLDNAALRFGASVFTTMRVYEQQLNDVRSQYPAHCDRLTYSLQAFDWQQPDWPSIYRGAQQLALHYPVIRITLFPDGTEWITGRALPPQLESQQQNGIACWLAPATYARSLPTHKTGNYLACWLARQQAQKQGAQEAILTNFQGDWLETATGNLWGWADGQWWTPIGESLENKNCSEPESQPESQRKYKDRCLPGLMRKKVRRVLEENGLAVNGQLWDQSIVSRFEAIAYTNCVVEVVPIHTILSDRTTLEYNAHHASLKALRQWLASSS